MFNKKKKKLDKLIDEWYMEGFWSGIGHGPDTAILEYTSTSGYYHYNNARRLMYKYGYKVGMEYGNYWMETKLGMNKSKWASIVGRKAPSPTSEQRLTAYIEVEQWGK